MHRTICLLALLFIAPHLAAADTTVAPKLTKRVEADFPWALKMAFMHPTEPATNGTAKVEFVVTPAGRVAEARIVSAVHREMGPPALAAVMKWRFKPATKDGKIVPVRMQVEIWFGMLEKPGMKGPRFDPTLVSVLPDWTESTKKTE